MTLVVEHLLNKHKGLSSNPVLQLTCICECHICGLGACVLVSSFRLLLKNRERHTISSLRCG
jgi:hypothetical protein